VKAIILLGGEGTRLRPLTYTTPKQLLPIVEVAMLERVLGHLRIYGVSEAVLSLGYRPDAFMGAYPDGHVAGVAVEYAVEPEPLDTAGAIRFAADHVEVDQTFLVVNGDVLTDLDVGALIEFHRSCGAAATLALTPVDDPSRFGVVPTDDTGRVEAFVEKPEADKAPTNLINAGTYVLEPSVLPQIPAGRRVSIERETFPLLVAQRKVYALAGDSYWLDTGTPEAYLKAHADLLSGVRGGPPAPGAVPAPAGPPNSWVIGSPDIKGVVGPKSLVGDQATVEKGGTIDGSVVGAGCLVEGGAEVRGSVLLPGARVRRGASVVGSIIGHRAVVGAGASLEPTTVVGDDAVVEDGSRVHDGRIAHHPH
jgi:mannose-1-phosphate guanylyltransferase